MRPVFTACIPVFLMFSACLPPPLNDCSNTSCTAATTSSATVGDDPPLPTSGIHTVTGAEDTSSSTTEDPPGTSTGEPAPPVIVEVERAPNPITSCGAVAITVHTTDTTKVQMALDTGELVELAPAGRDKFMGKIPAYSGVDNGTHPIELTPSREDITGATISTDYEVAFLAPGQERYWETSFAATGRAESLGVLPDGRVVELLTLYELNQPRCHLRVRDANGQWDPQTDMVPLLPGQHCEAIDLTVAPGTAIIDVLVHREVQGEVQWWVGEIAGWGGGLKAVAQGSLGVRANALAQHAEMLAVCGARTVPEGDLDAYAVLLQPGQDNEERLYDYVDPGNPEHHKFQDTARDCTFSKNTLVLTGWTNGDHTADEGVDIRDRLLLIEDDVLSGAEATWTVAGPESGVHSRALAVATNPAGEYLLAGYTCAELCKPEGELWRYEPGGALTWQKPLGVLGSDLFGPHALAWSPAGHVVVARGKQVGPKWVFNVEAFAPGSLGPPLWSFKPLNQDGNQLALDLAVDACGVIYAVGISLDNFPTFAAVTP